MEARKRIRISTIAAAGCLALAGSFVSQAGMDLETETSVAGMSVAFNNFYAGAMDPVEEASGILLASEAAAVADKSVVELPVVAAPRSPYEDIAVSKAVKDVNIRTEPNTESAIVGKIHNRCAATIQSTVEGEDGTWYQIQSGNVNGYIKAEYFLTGAEAQQAAREVGTAYAVVASDTPLRLRETPELTGKTLSMLPSGAQYEVTGEQGDFYQIAIDSDLTGYVYKEYMQAGVEFPEAVSLVEEQERQREAARRQQEAEDAIRVMEEVRMVQAKEDGGASQNQEPPRSTGGAALSVPPAPVGETARATEAATTAAPKTTTAEVEAVGTIEAFVPDPAEEDFYEPPARTTSAQTVKPPSGSSVPSSGSSTSRPGGAVTPISPGGATEVVSATRAAVIAYAKQFLGNPYVFGGTSLTNGADCSGFTMSVFAHFGIQTGRSSRDQAAKGRPVDVDAAQPGDLLFYASGDYINHVAIYIGNNQVIHASNERTGITISPANYRTPCKAVSFLD